MLKLTSLSWKNSLVVSATLLCFGPRVIVIIDTKLSNGSAVTQKSQFVQKVQSYGGTYWLDRFYGRARFSSTAQNIYR